MNQCIFSGYVSERPELKTTTSGLEVCSFDLAVPRKKKGNDGKLVYDYITIEAWREKAEFACRYLEAGTKINVVTTLKTDSYKTQDGTTRKKFTFVLDEAEFCERKQAGAGMPQAAQNTRETPNEQTPAGGQNATRAQPTAPHYEDLADDEELPF